MPGSHSTPLFPRRAVCGWTLVVLLVVWLPSATDAAYSPLRRLQEVDAAVVAPATVPTGDGLATDTTNVDLYAGSSTLGNPAPIVMDGTADTTIIDPNSSATTNSTAANAGGTTSDATNTSATSDTNATVMEPVSTVNTPPATSDTNVTAMEPVSPINTPPATSDVNVTAMDPISPINTPPSDVNVTAMEPVSPINTPPATSDANVTGATNVTASSPTIDMNNATSSDANATAAANGTLLLPASSRTISVKLGMGCPEFLSAFYEANASSTEPFRSFSITKGAGYGYVALFFPQLWLPQGASLVLHAVEDVDVPDRYMNLTEVAFQSGVMYTDVYAPPMLARELLVEVYRDVGPAAAAHTESGDAPSSDATSTQVETPADATTTSVSDRHCYGFVVNGGHYVLEDTARNITPSSEATCANDNSREAICYYNDLTTRTAYLAARTVARLLITKEDGQDAACTGWLLGSEGHLITNYHCVNTTAQADATNVEFMADATSCSSSCMDWGECPGTVEAISTKLVHANATLDYALLKLQTNINLPAKYGFLRLKKTLASVGEEIYIPQHPLYYGKRIAMVNDFGTKTTILSTNASGCDTTGYSYNGDTQAGSSGSPVIDAADHGVVALHHCGQFCANTGIPSHLIVADLIANDHLPANAVDPGDDKNTANFPAWQPPEVVAPLTLNTVLEFNGTITRNDETHTASVDQFEFVLAEDAEMSFDVRSTEISDDGVFHDLNHDCDAMYVDSIMFLFRAGQRKPVFTKDDDKLSRGRSDGSISLRDPYARTFLKAGTYVLALAAMPVNASSAYNGVVPLGSSDVPEIYTCTKHTQVGPYHVQFKSSQSVTFNRKPQAVDPLNTTCSLPANLICSF